MEKTHEKGQAAAASSEQQKSEVIIEFISKAVKKMLLKSTAFVAFSSARLINIPISENNFVDFSDYEHLIENKDEFNFAVFTDAQFGKYDKENGGDGIDVSYDIERVVEMCSQISEMSASERPAFIMNL